MGLGLWGCCIVLTMIQHPHSPRPILRHLRIRWEGLGWRKVGSFMCIVMCVECLQSVGL